MSALVCEHGSLRRKCELCERDERIKELEDELASETRWAKEYSDDLLKANARVKELEAFIGRWTHRTDFTLVCFEAEHKLRGEEER